MNITANLESLALHSMVNSSPAMVDRRRRILSEARRMISSIGPDAFNMRDLGKRAEVSTRTIYNAFGSRETVIALAIYTYFEKFMSLVEFEENHASFDGALARQTTSTLRDVEFPNYMRAVVELYFSTTLHADIRAVLFDIAVRSWVPWLTQVEAEGRLEKGVNLNELLLDISNLQYSRILEWCKGGVDDEAFIRRTLSGILLLIAGAATGDVEKRIRATYSQLQSDIAFRQQLLADARRRIVTSETAARENRRPRKTSRSNLRVIP